MCRKPVEATVITILVIIIVENLQAFIWLVDAGLLGNSRWDGAWLPMGLFLLLIHVGSTKWVLRSCSSQVTTSLWRT